MSIRSIVACVVLGAAMLIPRAVAAEPNLDFGVVDEPSFQAFRGAIRASEYARYDFVNDARPRVAATAAALVTYATRNPMATPGQLATFAIEYDAALRSYQSGDPDLYRASNLMRAVRYGVFLTDVTALDGTDTDVGADTMELLGIDIPEFFDWLALGERTVSYDLARTASIANSKEWANLLVVGFSGRDLTGEPNAHLFGALRFYLESQGLEPVPDGVNDGRFQTTVDVGLSQLPTDYAGYSLRQSALQVAQLDTAPEWTSVMGAFTAVRSASATLQTELGSRPATSIIQGIENAGIPAFTDTYQNALNQVADERTIVSVNALMMLQNADPSIRGLATQIQSFGQAQLETNKTWAALGIASDIAGSVGAIGLAYARGDAVGMAKGALNAVAGAIGLGGLFGGGPSQEDQIFEEVKQIRMEVEAMRAQMHGRFDRIEEQLNVVYQSMVTQFDRLGDDIGELGEDIEEVQATVDDIELSLVRNNQTLERIEEALWGLESTVFEIACAVEVDDLAEDVNTAFLQVGKDPSFSTFQTSVGATLFTAATSTSTAGICAPTTPALTLGTGGANQSNIAELLDRPTPDGRDASIGNHVNRLRVFPSIPAASGGMDFGVSPSPFFGTPNLPSPALWSQAATTYAQLARLYPWFYAYEYQLNDAVGIPKVDRIITTGTTLDSATGAGRNQQLFDALFLGYDATLQLLDQEIDQIEDLEEQCPNQTPCSSLDPWGGLDQDVGAAAGAPDMFCQGTCLYFDGCSIFGCIYSFGWASPYGNAVWNVMGQTDVPEIAAVLRGSNTAGDPQISVNLQSEGPGLLSMSFGYASAGGAGTLTRKLVLQHILQNGQPSQQLAGWPQWLVYHSGWQSWLISGPLSQSVAISGKSCEFCSYFPSGELRLVSDTVTSDSLSNGVLSNLNAWQNRIWTHAAGDAAIPTSDIAFLEAKALGYEALIEAYATFSMPDLLEQSTVARAGFRARTCPSWPPPVNPMDPEFHCGQGELALEFPAPLESWLVGPEFVNAQGDEPRFRFWGEYANASPKPGRASYVKSEVDLAIELPREGQSYIDWVLAELTRLSDHPYALAVDDVYQPVMNDSLTVPDSECSDDGVACVADVDCNAPATCVPVGLLANDVDQQFLSIAVDTTFTSDPLHVAPQHGTVLVNADGSFTYDPNPGYFGPDSFNYRACAAISAGMVCSEPATVSLLVNTCGDGTVDAGEECDDSAQVSGDGCSAACLVELCGDGVLQPGIGEQCDDGNTVDEDGCSAGCLDEFCGDGVVQPVFGEQCDDGNLVDGDGCFTTCLLFSDACGEVDTDGDGAPDLCDDDPGDPLACSDLDGDGCDDCSIGPVNPANDGADADLDGVCDAGDSCPDVPNPDQQDGQDTIRRWASNAFASSEFSPSSWSALQATGAPDTGGCGDISTAWAPQLPDSDPEWLEVEFGEPLTPTGVNIHETNIGSFVYQVDLRLQTGALLTVWTGTDTTPCPGVLSVTWPAHFIPATGVRIYTQVDDWQEIDAVEIVAVDGVDDACDGCPLTYDPVQSDLDADGVGDACDVCPSDADPGQSDLDGDGLGDACDVCSEAGSVISGFGGAYALENWTATANVGGTATISPASGSPTSAQFRYEVDLGIPGGGVPPHDWTFSTTAVADETVSFGWSYSGFHAAFAAEEFAQVFVDGPGGVTTTTLATGATVNGFGYAGAFEVNVNAGYDFGFVIGGENYDFNSVLYGTLTISNIVFDVFPQGDVDGDGLVCGDNCPYDANPGQSDLNGNGVGDACDDTDLDGLFGADDNCPFVFNPDQLDADLDGAGDDCDLCPVDDQAWGVPGEVTALQLLHVGGATGATTLSWSAPTNLGGVSAAYDTVRATLAGDFVGTGSCVESDDSDLIAVDTTAPASGQVLFFLVRGGNACAGEGSAGTDSAGGSRSVLACPIAP